MRVRVRQKAGRFGRRLTLALYLFLILASAASGRDLPPVAHFYYVNEDTSRESLRANGGQVELLSPQWLIVVDGGKLASTVDPEVVQWAQERGVPLMPLLLNFEFKPQVAHELLTDEALQAQLIREVVQVASQYRFYGLQLDFENVPVEDRGRYVAFVRRLGRTLRQRGMKLSVAVPAPLAAVPLPSGRGINDWPQTEISLAFDYRRLGREADFLSLMTYDQHTEPDAPGPVAGLPWVEASLRWVLKSVPRNKLHLGLPLYYRQWTGETVSEGTYEEVAALAARVGAIPRADPVHVEKTFEFKNEDAPAVVWLQDAETLRERVQLVRRYKLRGFSAWRLGQEDPAAWKRAFAEVAGRTN